MDIDLLTPLLKFIQLLAISWIESKHLNKDLRGVDLPSTPMLPLDIKSSSQLHKEDWSRPEAQNGQKLCHLPEVFPEKERNRDWMNILADLHASYYLQDWAGGKRLLEGEGPTFKEAV